MEQSGESLSEVLEGTVAVARGLEALQSEHESLLAELGAGQQSGELCGYSLFSELPTECSQ